MNHRRHETDQFNLRPEDAARLVSLSIEQDKRALLVVGEDVPPALEGKGIEHFTRYSEPMTNSTKPVDWVAPVLPIKFNEHYGKPGDDKWL